MSEQGLLRQAAKRALSGIRLIIGRGRVLLTVDNDQGPVQVVQARISADEVMNLLRVPEFGFTSRLPKDTDVVAVFIGGDRQNGIIVGSNHQALRFKLENDGEMAVYDAFGKSIWFKKDGGIVLNGGAQKLTIENIAGLEVTTTDDVKFNMGGKDFIIDNPGTTMLAGTGGKKVALDQDPVVANKVNATSTKVTGK